MKFAIEAGGFQSASGAADGIAWLPLTTSNKSGAGLASIEVASGGTARLEESRW